MTYRCVQQDHSIIMGPGLKITDRRALPDFARDVLNNNDIVMLSDGSPTRTFCYVADAIVGYYKILTRGRNGDSYNIWYRFPRGVYT